MNKYDDDALLKALMYLGDTLNSDDQWRMYKSCLHLSDINRRKEIIELANIYKKVNQDNGVLRVTMDILSLLRSLLLRKVETENIKIGVPLDVIDTTKEELGID